MKWGDIIDAIAIIFLNLPFMLASTTSRAYNSVSFILSMLLRLHSYPLMAWYEILVTATQFPTKLKRKLLFFFSFFFVSFFPYYALWLLLSALLAMMLTRGGTSRRRLLIVVSSVSLSGILLQTSLWCECYFHRFFLCQGSKAKLTRKSKENQSRTMSLTVRLPRHLRNCPARYELSYDNHDFIGKFKEATTAAPARTLK